MCDKKRLILVGNAFPLGLVRRPVSMEPVTPACMREELKESDVASFWGHEGTRYLAEALAGVYLRPATERPALRVSEDGLPELDGVVYHVCYVISPEYVSGWRPAIGAPVPPEQILSWRILRMLWNE